MAGAERDDDQQGQRKRPGKRRPGRPSALTPDVESRILNAVRCGVPKKGACAAAGIAEDTLYGWLERARTRPGSEYADFAVRLEKARHEGIAARAAIVMKAAQKDWRAAAWMLERDLPEHFSPKARLEHGVDKKTMSWAEMLTRLREDRRPALKEAETC